MPRPRQWPPTVHVHRTGQAFVRVAGRDYYLGVAGSDAAKTKYAELVARLAAAPAGDPGDAGTAGAAPPGEPRADLTVAELVALYLRHAEEHRPAGGAELREFRRVARVLNRTCGDLPANDFRAAQLERVRDRMMAGDWQTDEERAYRRNGAPPGWCRNVVNRQVVRIRTMFKWAEFRGLVPEGRHHHLATLAPLARNDRRVRNTKPRRPVSRAHVDAVLDRVPAPVAAMIELQWWSGMRPSEVCRMRVQDLDTGGEIWHYRLDAHKSSWRDGEGYEGEAVSLGRECQRVLGPWLHQPGRPIYLFRPAVRRKEPCYTPASYCRAVLRACAAAGIPRWSPYQLRHSAKARLEAEFGTAAAAAQLRQRSLETTKRYAQSERVRLADETARKAC